MKNKLIIGLMITAMSNQVFALGVTKLLQTTGESLFESVKSSVKSEITKASGKSTKNSNSKSVSASSKESADGSSEASQTSGQSSRFSSEDSTKNSPKASTQAVKGSAETSKATTEYLICENKCQQLLDEPALVPAAEKYLQGEAISLTDAGKLDKFITAMKKQNPQLAQHPQFEEAVLVSLVNGDL